ncbi:MAG TPA: hypothetical protein VKZ87_01025 [Ferrovibrio sp.]|uniref:hypothetical protein n=1 Tax=Ferrovibrio sp. TaxID=1917215 RepID=UPI002B4AB5BD|nr:hypothetical protein [Ferrovibrio sp.]HLT75939.1 hypothetical protein [Ferrovibrio sp.]
MAYSSKTLSVLGYANGFTLWHYATPDPAASVDTSGYFNAAADMLRVGDFILANTGQGSGAPQHGIFVVAANQNGTVDLADLTPAAAANSD